MCVKKEYTLCKAREREEEGEEEEDERVRTHEVIYDYAMICTKKKNSPLREAPFSLLLDASFSSSIVRCPGAFAEKGGGEFYSDRLYLGLQSIRFSPRSDTWEICDLKISRIHT